MADGKKVKLNSPFKDAVCKAGGGLTSPQPQSAGTQKGSK